MAVHDAGHPPRRHPLRSRRAAVLRLLALGIVVGGGAVAAASGVPHSPEALRDAVAATGVTGIAVAAVAWTALTPLLVSGVVLALAAGALFGVATGTAIGIAGATAGGVASFLIARFGGGGALDTLAGPRADRLLARIERRGFLAVLGARLAPGVPATLLNYAAGLTRVRLRHFAPAIAVGGAPRNFAYAALGGSGGDVGAPTTIVAIAVVVALAAVGVVLGLWAWRRRRAQPAG